MNGKLIAIYGMNHLHKEGHAGRIASYLKVAGKKTEIVRYPVYSIAPSGFYIEKFLKAQMKMTNEELQMWFALNKYQYQPILKKKLEDTIIICKDYIGTQLAWGTLDKDDYGWLEALNAKLIEPDLSILLDSEQFMSERADHIKGREDILPKIRQRFLDIARERNWLVVNSDKNVSDVFMEVIKAVKEKLGI